jgi:hypothetical protein
MRLMDAGIEALHSQGEIYRIKVVEIMAPKNKATDGHRSGQETDFQFRPKDHFRHLSNCNAISDMPNIAI